MSAENVKRIGRRSALLLSTAGLLSGCDLWDGWFGEKKVPLPGKREPVLADTHSLDVDTANRGPIALPAATANPDWSQPGGTPQHLMGNLASNGRLAQAWRADIGVGSGYRRKLTAQPLVADGRVYTMDSDAVLSALDLRGGGRIWQFDTKGEKDRSTNVGGGVTTQGGVLYAATGRGDLLALDGAKGTVLWRTNFGVPARSAPTWAAGLLYFVTLDGQIMAMSDKDGSRVWSYQAANVETSLLGQPAPAVSDGLVVAGFGSGDLVALRGDTGAVVWSDSLGASSGRNAVANMSAIHGMPVIDSGRVFAVGLGGLMLSLDLRAGRRLWQREIAGSETPWLAGDWIFLLTADQQMVAMGRDDGRVRWVSGLPRYQVPEKQRDPILWTGPVLAGSQLFIGGDNKKLMAIDPLTGATIGTQDLSGPVSVPPIVAGGTLVALTDDGAALAMR